MSNFKYNFRADYSVRLAKEDELGFLAIKFKLMDYKGDTTYILERAGKPVMLIEAESMMSIKNMTQLEGESDFAKMNQVIVAAAFLKDLSEKSGAVICGRINPNKENVIKVMKNFGATQMKRMLKF